MLQKPVFKKKKNLGLFGRGPENIKLWSATNPVNLDMSICLLVELISYLPQAHTPHCGSQNSE